MVKNLPANAGDTGDTGSIPGWGRSPRVGHGNPVFLPGKFHGQESGGLQSMASQRVRPNLVTEHAHTNYKKKLGRGPVSG